MLSLDGGWKSGASLFRVDVAVHCCPKDEYSPTFSFAFLLRLCKIEVHGNMCHFTILNSMTIEEDVYSMIVVHRSLACWRTFFMTPSSFAFFFFSFVLHHSDDSSRTFSILLERKKLNLYKDYAQSIIYIVYIIRTFYIRLLLSSIHSTVHKYKWLALLVSI